MVKLEKSKNKEEIKYLEQILQKVGEINSKADHLITVFRERFYTPFNCPYADLRYSFGKVKGRNNNNIYNNNNYSNNSKN